MNNFYDDISQYSSQIAIVTRDGKKVNYTEFVANADFIAEKTEPGSLVILICKNCEESVSAYIGFLRRRAVPILVNAGIDKDFFQNLLQNYRANYIFCPKDFDIVGAGISEFLEYKLLKYSDEKIEINPELALLLTTSGSTGSPKLVRQSHKNITSNANSIANYLQIEESDRAISTLPMSYTYGLSIIQSHLLKGARIILNDYTFMEKNFWSLLKEEEATTFGGVPYVYEMLKRLRFFRMDLPSLKYLTQAGGKLSKELSAEFAEECHKKGMRFIVMYGQAEATARMSYLPDDKSATKAGSIGIAIPGGNFSLIDTYGNEITEPNTVGELVYSGDNVTLGYAESDSDLSLPDENIGRLITGDMAEYDSEGYYYIVGRKKRFLKLFGNRINLQEVEKTLCDAGYDCVCGGVDDLLKIYLTNQGKAEEARAFISQKTGLNTVGFKAIEVGEIPRNEAGKVLYTKLEEL